MQVIAVCELEEQIYGSSTIDRIQEFGALMAYFRSLNELINEIKEGETKMSPPFVEFDWKGEEITDIAIEASARLFYTPEEAHRVTAAVKGYLAEAGS